jgi:hypothetical protein
VEPPEHAEQDGSFDGVGRRSRRSDRFRVSAVLSAPDRPSSRERNGALMPEMDLLIECARLRLDPQREARVRALIADGLDTERLATLATYHKLVPLLYLHVQKGSIADGDPSLRNTLRPLFLNNAQRSIRLIGELLEIVWTLEKDGILSLPYKGPALAAQLYGNATLRQSADLDLLVRRGDVRRARALLMDRGYRPKHPLSDAGEAFMIANRYHETLIGPATVVELHWAFTNRDVAFPLDLDALAPRLTRLALGGHEVNAFSPEDLLLVLCVHGAKHRWDRLEWCAGVAELVRSGTVSCTDAIEASARLGVRRMVLLGLGLAHDVLDAPLEPHVLAAVRADAAVQQLSLEVSRTLSAGEPRRVEEPGDADRFRLRLREGWRERLRFLLDRITTPSSPTRWAAVRIGGYNFPAHAILRPLQLIGKVLAILHRRLVLPSRHRDS